MTFKSFLAAIVLCFFAILAVEAQITSATSGPWNLGSTWVGGVVPVAGNDVLITSNHVIDVTADAACKDLTLNTTGKLNFSGGGPITITMSGNLTMNGNTLITGASNAHILNVGGSFSVPAPFS